MIDVINRGIGGQEAPAEFARLEQGVIAEQPSLVIWQVGTNSVWQSPDQHPPSLDKTIEAVRNGISRLREIGTTDIVLMDLQFVPALLTPAKIGATSEMVSAIADVACEMQVNLFRRFELMKRWHEIEKRSFDVIVNPNDPDRLHDSDWATQRLAQSLMNVIAGGVAKALAAPGLRS